MWISNYWNRLDTKDKLYGTPGGHLEYGESFESCAARELKEELNIDIAENQIRYLTTLNVINKEAKVHYLNIFMVTLIPDSMIDKI